MLTASLLAFVKPAIHMEKSTVSAMKRTPPSTIDTWTPPGCLLMAARLLERLEFGGQGIRLPSLAITYPCDWWLTKKNGLQPFPSLHQACPAVCVFSSKWNVLLVPSLT